MAGGALATAYVQLVPKMEGFSDKLGKAVSKAGRDGGNSYKSNFLNGVGAVAIGNVLSNALTGAITSGASAIKGVISDSLGNYAQYEQLVGGVETLFKGSADIVQEYASNAYKTAGMSANQYMDTVTSFSASLIASLGGDTNAAAEKANVAITDMSDNANKMGSSMESIQNAYQGFAKQNYTMLDNLKLGYGGTKSEMERLLSDAEKISGIKYDISSYSDVVDAIHVVQTEMGITGTTAKEAASTIEGSVNSMKGAWQNWLTGLGDPNADMEALSKQLVDTVVTAAGNIIPRLGEIFMTLGSTITETLPTVFEEAGNGLRNIVLNMLVDIFGSDTANAFLEFTDGLKAKFDGLVEMLMPLGETLGSIFSQLAGTVTTVLGPTFDFIYGLFTNYLLPTFQSIASSVDSFLMPAIQSLGGAWNHLLEALGPVIEALQPVAEFIGNVLVIALSTAIEVISAVIDVIASIIEGFSHLADAGSAVSDFVNGVIGFFTNLGSSIGSIVSGLVSSVIGFFGNMISNVISAVSGWWSSVTSSISSGVSNAISTVSQLPSQIIGLFANAGSWLIDSGRSIIRGLIDGIGSMIGAAKDAVGGVLSGIRNLLPFSPAKEGPFSGKGWTLYSGRSIVEALSVGISGMKSKAVGAMRGVMSDVATAASADFSITGSPSFRALNSTPAYTAASSRNANGTGANITIYVDGAIGPEATAQMIAHDLQRYARMGVI